MNSAPRSTRSSRRTSQLSIQEAQEAIPEEIKEEMKEEEMQADDTNTNGDSNADNNNNNDHQMKVDEDGNESSSLGSINDEMEEEEEEELDPMSPSPNKQKDMSLRSGKRKRRRSRETTGLTPPEAISEKKRARRSAKKPKAIEDGAPTQQETIAEEEEEEEVATKPVEDNEEEAAAPRKARDSILLSDHMALAEAHQEPEATTTVMADDPVDDTDDNGRRLFDAKPPTMMPTTTTTTPATTTCESQSPVVVVTVNGTTAPAAAPVVETEPTARMESTTTKTTEAPLEELELPPSSEFINNKSNSSSSKLFLVLLYIGLMVVSLKVWVPIAGKLALAIVPLHPLETPTTDAMIEEEEEDPEVALEDEDEAATPPVPNEILDGLAELEKVQKLIGGSSQGLESYKAEMDVLIKMLKKNADVTKRKMMIRFSRLMEAERVLQTAIEDSDSSSPEAWKNAQKMVEALKLPNKKLVDTSMIDMWQVEDPLECPDDDAQVDNGTPAEAVVVAEDDLKDPPISPRNFETTETNLLLRATMTAEKIVRSQKSEDNVRAWVREKIDTAIEDDDEILAALEQIQAISSMDDDDANAPLSIEMIGSLLQERLELELADGTGAFDHAALMSGAKIIYGGKRGTTKSITNSLPLYNRLMQLAHLRFYGHGPEAAITPTFPKNTLGQCWSFQPLSVKEQLKISSNDQTTAADDHRHGGFGTLTISFANPVKIESISIEHPTVTDHPKSAIRGFRIIGFEDELAEGSGQPMGSFQYQLDGPSLQEFPVAEKGAMQSLSLAIDSNWGLEYACLYRFRVHGIGMEDEEDD